MAGEKARDKKSRAGELRFIAGFLDNPSGLIVELQHKANGGSTEIQGIEFVWGNIAELLLSMDTENLQSHKSALLEMNPKHVYHLDNLSPSQQKAMVENFDISSKSLSFHLNKADVLLVDDKNNPIFISVKDETAITKLGQVANKKYGSAELVGGFRGIDLSHFECPDEISASDTWLKDNQFAKLGKNSKDRKCAYIKKKYPIEWTQLVNNSLNSAYRSLEEFSKRIIEDRNCISEFILLTLVGESVPIDNFFIAFGENVIDVERLLFNIKTKDFAVEIEPHVSEGDLRKVSSIIWLVFPERKYCLTKIEPAFDGGYDVHASQTKGIQYYFQQWPNTKAMNSQNTGVFGFKQFLLDISQ